jgi:hypothetical protein
MTIILYIGAMLALTAFQMVKQKREQDKRRAEIAAQLPGVDALQFPMVSESQPVPVLFGTHWLRGPNVLWYGFFRQRQVVGDLDAGVVRFDGVTYLSYCRGPIDKVLRITGDGVLVDDTSRDLSGGPVSFTLDRWDIWGDPQRGGQGGLNGMWTLYPGYQNQVTPELFTQTLKDIGGNTLTDFRDNSGNQIMPAFRGLFTVMMGGYLPPNTPPTVNPPSDPSQSGGSSWQGTLTFWYAQDSIDRFFFGSNPVLKPVEILAQRLNVRGLGEAQWYSETVVISDTEMNPAHIIHELMTDETLGYAIPSQYMDDAIDGESTFQEAANVLSGTDQIGLSFVWGQQATRLETIMEVLRHINGVLVRNPRTGKYELRLFRDDYDAASLPLLGPESIADVMRYSRPDASTLPTVLDAKYMDRETGTEKIVKQDDQSGILTRGEIREEVYFQMAARGDMASRIATQYMIEISAPLATVELSLPLSLATTYLPGDVFRWSWPDYGIEQMVLRVVSVSRGALEDGNVRLRCIEDRYAWRDTVYAPAPDSGWQDPVTPALDASAAQFEAPLLLRVGSVRQSQPFASVDDLAADERGVGTLCVFRPNESHTSYDLWTDVTGSLPRLADSGADWSAQVYFDGTLEPTRFTDADILPATTTITLKVQGVIPQVGALLLLGSGASKLPQEIMMVTASYEDDGDRKIDVERALMDTVEYYAGLANPVGVVDPVAVVIGRAIDDGKAPFQLAKACSLDVPRTTANSRMRALTSTGRGNLAYDDATERIVPLEGRGFLPIPPYIFNIEEASSEITVRWRHRNRLTDRLILTSENVAAETGVTYTLSIFEVSPTPRLLRTVTALDGTDDDYIYTNATEESDRGGGLATVLRFQMQAHRDGKDSYYMRSKLFTRL